MSNINEQNGRLSTPHQQSSAPKDPRTKRGPSSGTTTSSDPKSICRDYIWGICTMGTECKYRHELEYNSMRATLKFCHNFQNKGVCDWPDCTYLHISREEENLFVTTGQIPRILADRYAAMSVYEYILAPPPPPPPPTTTTTTPRNAPPTYTAQPPAPTVVAASLPPTLPAIFDPTRPPPPLPAKRRLSDSSEAGTTSKMRKVDSPDILCDNCLQRELRIKICKQEMEKMLQEEEKHRLILKKKVEDFQNCKLVLRSIVNPKWYSFLDSYIEGTNQGNNLFSQLSSSLVSESSTVPRQFLVQLFECVLGSSNSRNNVETVPLTSRESLLESLSGLNRRSNASSSSSPDMLQTLLESLRPSSTVSEQRSPNEQRSTSERAGTGNGITRLANGGAPPVSGPMPASVPYAPPSVQTAVLPPARPYYAQPYPPPAPPTASAPQSASQPHPQPYYAQQFGGMSGSAAQCASSTASYPSVSTVASQYSSSGVDSGASQQTTNARNYLYSSNYQPYYPPAPSYH